MSLAEDLAAELRAGAYADLIYPMDPALIVTLAAVDDSTSTVAEHRDRRTNGFARQAGTLWRHHELGELTRGEVEHAAHAAVDRLQRDMVTAAARRHGVRPDAVTAIARAHLIRMGASAVQRVTGQLYAYAPDTADADRASYALTRARGNRAAGPIHAMHYLVEAAALRAKWAPHRRARTYAEGDDGDGADGGDAGDTGDGGEQRPDYSGVTATWSAVGDDATCDPCSELDGESWPVEEIPFWPGDDGPCEGDGNCRCELNFDEPDEEPPAPEEPPPSWAGKLNSEITDAELDDLYAAMANGTAQYDEEKGWQVVGAGAKEPAPEFAPAEDIKAQIKAALTGVGEEETGPPSWAGKFVSDMTDDEYQAYHAAIADGTADVTTGVTPDGSQASWAFYVPPDNPSWAGKFTADMSTEESNALAQQINANNAFVDNQGWHLGAPPPSEDDLYPSSAPAGKAQAEQAATSDIMGDLTTGENAALRGWQSSSGPVHDWETGETTRGVKLQEAEYNNFTAAMAKLPDYSGTVYRGLKYLDEEAYSDIVNVDEYVFNTTQSSSVSENVARGFAGNGYEGSRSVVLEMTGDNVGKDLRPYAEATNNYTNEQEVIVPQYSTYRVDEVLEYPDYTVVRMSRLP